ncbi:O-acetylhomoserine aminocarboxypropyltransferase [Sneathiella aquimaris]|uniref:O-acetylhomoserine aminocarboxypropyltransferase n=1 Tax=Sneathiella aquimaris TaxID=2599305 RepID=UPI00146E4891|nr:O-acetylhomoserine aminocarboxypropyltransferase [Sneathiella aquimaris]
MADPNFLKFDTLSLHAGHRPDPVTGSRAVPIYQTTSYVFKDADHAASLFNLEATGHIYTRLSNPTTAVLEERLASLEGGIGAICTASGHAALHLAIVTLMSAGSHIVCSGSVYGGTYNFLKHTMPRFGINTTFVNPQDTQAFADAINDDTRLVISETFGNPGLEVTDIRKVSDIAHAAGIPLLIDNTFGTPYLCRPFEFGADLVMHSATKFLGGHGIAMGGALIDSGNFDWEKSGKFPTMTEPYEGYHGIQYAEEFGPLAFLMRARTEGIRDFGACISPTNAFQILQGVETLSIRMEKHVTNARKVIDFLVGNDAVESVSYPELPDHPDHELAKQMFPKGCGSIFSFTVKGGREAGKAFIGALQVFSHLANVGDAKSLVIHPASTTHQQMDQEALKAAGISEGMIRLSVGIEDADDLIKDLKLGLRSAAKAAEKANAA